MTLDEKRVLDKQMHVYAHRMGTISLHCQSELHDGCPFVSWDGLMECLCICHKINQQP